MIHELHALANGQAMGRVLWNADTDRLGFEYDRAWQENAQA